jgi:hypothetical protein
MRCGVFRMAMFLSRIAFEWQKEKSQGNGKRLQTGEVKGSGVFFGSTVASLSACSVVRIFRPMRPLPHSFLGAFPAEIFFSERRILILAEDDDYSAL